MREISEDEREDYRMDVIDEGRSPALSQYARRVRAEMIRALDAYEAAKAAEPRAGKAP